jgi:hypothetical protein
MSMKPAIMFALTAATVGAVVSCRGTGSSPSRADAAQNGGSDDATASGGSDGRALGGGGILGSGGIEDAAAGDVAVGTGGNSIGGAGGSQEIDGPTATGGKTASGGTSATGGLSATGGATVGLMGGTAAGGGATATGGAIATGGNAGTSMATGGRTLSGGTSATGGQTTTGGSTGSGGSILTGGTIATGGAAATGGSTGSGGNTSLSWEFSNDAQGWIGGFADYPPNVGTGYDLEYGWATLPTEVGPGGGLRTSGNNHSDDLFMFVTRQLTGLTPQSQYLLDVVAVIDTNAPADCGGIGGAPGISVTVKIGAVPSQPTSSADSQGYLRLNLDKGNQSVGGTDMKAVGNLGNTRTCPDRTYEAKTYTLSGFSVTSASDGTLWLVLGTDSGFEGITTIYYDRIAVVLRQGK